jgi:hypothetical protein
MHDGLDGLAARLLGSAPRFDFAVVFVTTFCDWGAFWWHCNCLRGRIVRDIEVADGVL